MTQSQLRLQVFPITPFLETETTFFVTTGIQAGVTYVLLDSIKQYFGGDICSVNLNEIIPSDLIKNLGGNGGLDPDTEWQTTQIPLLIRGNSQFTNAIGVMSLYSHLRKSSGEKITQEELEDFCKKVFPDFTAETDHIQHFKEYLGFIIAIQNHTKAEFNFSIHEMLRLWTNVVKASAHVDWLARFIDTLTTKTHREIHNYLPNFIMSFSQNNIDLPEIVCLIANMNTLIKVDKDRLQTPLNNDTRFRVFSYVPPVTNPLQSLLNTQISRISRLKLDDKTINKERIEALQKILSKNKYDKFHDPDLNCPNSRNSSKSANADNHSLIKSIDFNSMFKYPNPVILKYRENEKSVRLMNVFSAYNVFFMEISNRELYDINNTVCTIRVHQK